MPVGSKLASSVVTGSVVTIPNLISLARLCAVPVAVWLVLRADLAAAFWIFLIAGLTDGIDGWLARRGARSRLGAVLDPLADKALLTSMYIVLASVRLLPDWLAIMVVFRDVVIVGGVVLMSIVGEPVLIAPLAISKINTALQIVLIVIVLALAAFGLHPPYAAAWLIWCVAGTTFTSGALYVFKAAKG